MWRAGVQKPPCGFQLPPLCLLLFLVSSVLVAALWFRQKSQTLTCVCGERAGWTREKVHIGAARLQLASDGDVWWLLAGVGGPPGGFPQANSRFSPPVCRTLFDIYGRWSEKVEAGLEMSRSFRFG